MRTTSYPPKSSTKWKDSFAVFLLLASILLQLTVRA